jgi:hypothetical protein
MYACGPTCNAFVAVPDDESNGDTLMVLTHYPNALITTRTDSSRNNSTNDSLKH